MSEPKEFTLEEKLDKILQILASSKVRSSPFDPPTGFWNERYM